MNLFWKKIFIFFRTRFYRLYFSRIGKEVFFYGSLLCYGEIEIGNYCTFNHSVVLNGRGGIKIGNYCTISDGVKIYSIGLEINKDYKNKRHKFQPVIIEDGVWLCAGVIVNPGVKIGEGSVILPGSVVSKDVPAFEVWGGVPAKMVRRVGSNS